MVQLCANLTFLFKELPLFERFDAAAKAGFRFVEYQFPYDEDFEHVKDALIRNDLRMALINAPCGDPDAGEKGIAALGGREQEFKQSLEDAIYYARRLDCPRVHVMSGVVPDGEEDFALSVLAENLAFAARVSEAAGINVVIEPLNGHDVPGYLIQRTAQARAMIAMVAHPNLGLQMDAYHVLMNNEDPIDCLRANLDIIRHIQVAGYPGRNEPISEGTYDMRSFFEVCDMLGYSGVIGCEYNPRHGTHEGLGWASAYGIAIG